MAKRSQELSSPGIALRFLHPTLDPAKISERLNIAPSNSWCAGSDRVTPDGRRLKGVHKESYWNVRLRAKHNRSLEEDLAELLIKLRPHRRFIRELVRTGGTAAIYLTWSTSVTPGLELSSELVSELAGFRLALLAEAFPPSRENGVT